MVAIKNRDICKIVAVSKNDAMFKYRKNLKGKKVLILSTPERIRGGFITCQVEFLQSVFNLFGWRKGSCMFFRAVKLRRVNTSKKKKS
jgi:hypothetical protein